ncbi:restriction endonuclease subunit S [Rossellomorea vietnamensis]|uniref:restriction endonuclease subunit S n=1 Tax=Rossellomorea vietnamensis TaxID=218284 RepID=UPI003D280C63
MSKKKKTLEESVADSLLPKEEQSCKLPANWSWVRMGKIVSINPQKPKMDLPNERLCSFLPMSNVNPETGNIDELEERNFEKVKKGYTYFKENDVLFAKITPCMENGNTVVAKGLINNFGYGSTEFYVLRTPKQVNESYIYFLLRSEKFRKQAKAVMSGAVGQQRVPKKFLETYPLALPPLNEQIRIVKKVDNLFNKIEKAKQLIEDARETFELRRAAILNNAFRGVLTRKWRKSNPNTPSASVFLDVVKKKHSPNLTKLSKIVEDLDIPYELPKGWVWARINEVAELRSGYAFKSKDFVEDGIQLVRMGNLYQNELDLSRNPVYLPFDYDNKIINKYSLTNEMILLSLTGTKYKRDYGYAVRIKGIEEPLLLNQRILSVTPYEISDYFYYYLQSNTFRDMFFSFETGGVNQGNVGSKAVEGIYIPIPPEEEAMEIQNKIEEMLEKEKRALDLIQLGNHIESIKQSILSKAFRGELGTNDPSEESSIELIKEVLKEQVK